MRKLLDYSVPTLFVFAFTITVAVAVLVAASTSTVAFGAYNTGWDGTSDLRSLADATGTESHLVTNTSVYTERTPDATVSFIFAPEQRYSTSETARISRFVREGGTLVVADERTTRTNALLNSVGAEARIDGEPLRDERYNYQSPAAPIARNISTHPLTENVSSLTLNHGSAVNPGEATVLARTSGYTYRDITGNEELDQSEVLTDYPVVTAEDVGEGRIIVIGDPSIFINTMLERSDNRQFASNLFASHDHALLDYSHTASLPLLMQLVLLLRNTPILQALCGGVGVLLIAVLWSRPSLIATMNQHIRSAIPYLDGSESDFDPSASANQGSETSPSPIDDTDLVSYLRDRYPEWDDDRIHRIVAARRQQSQEDSSSTTE